jgi:hypothetical protein
MAFDAADVAARGNPGASIQQMHDLGDAYFARVYHD